ncbi:MAG: response regulator [Pseudomonadota bacterium]
MGSPPRILVIDDDAWILRMVGSVLEKSGYVVETASDGSEGLQKAETCPPDLIVSDVMMPRVDGWDLIKRLRARPAFALIPVIFLSALGSDDDRIKGFRLGADDYLPKPFRFEELTLRVAKALRGKRAIEEVLRDRALPTTAASSPSPLPPPGETQAAQQNERRPGIYGTLTEIGLGSLLALFEMERKSGLLVITRDFAARRSVGTDASIKSSSESGRCSSRSSSSGTSTSANTSSGISTDVSWDAGIDDFWSVHGLGATAITATSPANPDVLEDKNANGCIESGSIQLRQGKVVRARQSGSASLANEEAVYSMLEWTEGSFEFASGSGEPGEEMQASTNELLLEGARRLDETQRRRARDK